MKANKVWPRVIGFSLLIILFSLSIAHVDAQTDSEIPPLTFDVSANPSNAAPGEEIDVKLTLIGFPDACDPVETRRPLDVILLIDRSGSMEDPLGGSYEGSKLEGALDAIDQFADNIDPSQDRAGLVAFADNAVEYASLGNATGVTEARSNVLDAIGLLGGTRVGTGISHAVEQLHSNVRPDAQPVIILLTDGKSQDEPRDAAQEAEDANIRLITIGLGPDVDEELLRTIASTPSDYYYAPETSELKSIYETIVKSIQVFDPATDIHVSYSFDASNFELIDDSVFPDPSSIDVNTIQWNFETLQNNQQTMSLTLRAQVPGTYYAVLRANVDYLSCGQTPEKFEQSNQYPIEVISKGTDTPVCGGIPEEESTLLQQACGSKPWGVIGGLLVGSALLLLWLAKFWDDLRAWSRCRIPIPRCAYAHLPWRIWMAILAGLLLNAVTTHLCTPQEGIVFWRVLPDRSSAIHLKPTVPEMPVRALTPLVGEGQCVGCHTANVETQSIVAIAKGTNGMMTKFDFSGHDLPVPSIQGSYPSWSPDGRFIAYAANNEDIYILDVKNDLPLPLPGASEPGVVESMPAWTADGQHIAFVRSAGSDQNVTITTPSDIMMVPATGGVPVLVPGASGMGFNYHPAFSPDGKWMAFTHHTTGVTTYGDRKAEIYIVPTGGGAKRRLQANDGPGGQTINDAGNTFPTWAEDGAHLMFSSRRCDGQYDIYITQIDDDGNSGPAERLKTISDPQAFEYGAQEIAFAGPTLLERLLALWPWLVPLFIFCFLAWWLCRTPKLGPDDHSIELTTSVKPADGWLRPRQRFRVEMEMLGLPICEQQVIRRNVDAVLLIDCSGSMGNQDMGGKTRLNAAKKAARQFVRCLMGQRERVGVMSFESKPHLHLQLSTKEKDLTRAINTIELGDSTAMHSGLEKASEILSRSRRTKAVRVIVLLSDGAPDNSQLAIETAKKIRGEGVKIITVGIGNAVDEIMIEVAGSRNRYTYATNRNELIEAFLSAGRLLVTPPAASDITFTHRYDTEKFEIIPGTIMPRPQNQATGVISWQLPELDASRPEQFTYMVRPLEAGKNIYIDLSSDITYKHCGVDPTRSKGVPPSAKVTVRSFDIGKAPALIRDTKPFIKIKKTDAIWQPDKALFIGVGGTGRWVLTHIRKNLLDAGGGELPEGCEFLVLDTDEREKLYGKDVSSRFAGVEIASQDVFVIDENLQKLIATWAKKDDRKPEHKGWFKPELYQGLGQELNLATGTYGRRTLPRVALIRNLQSETASSQWQKKRCEENRSVNLKDWLLTRCKNAYRDDMDSVRVFIVGSLAGGMGGIIMDIANLTRLLAHEVISDAGKIRVEGYFIDGIPYENLPGGQDAPSLRLANTFASYREMSRWQLNPGLPFHTGWEEDSIIYEPSFDDVLLFSGNVGAESNLQTYHYPRIADVITARLDRATGAGEENDWLNQMRRARSDRQGKERMFTVGAASAYTFRLPVADILRALHARWAHRLLRVFLAGVEGNEILFDPSLTADPGFTRDPGSYVLHFLNSNGTFGGIAPIESQALFEFIFLDHSDLVETDELKLALDQDEDIIRQDIQLRLKEATIHILRGSIMADPAGSRAARLQYAICFLESLEIQMEQLQSRLLQEWEQESLSKVADIYREEALQKRSALEKMRMKLTSQTPNQEGGLLPTLKSLAAELEDIQDQLNQLSSRHYFWSRLETDAAGNPHERLFIEDWWNQYLANRLEDYVDYLGWVYEADYLDMEVRLAGNPVRLIRDGVDAVITAILQMAGNLTNEIWEETTLQEIIESHGIYEKGEYGRKARQISDVQGIIAPQGDSGVAEGRLFLMASPQILDVASGKAFEAGVCEPQPGESISVQYDQLAGTDRMSVTVLRLQDAVRLDRTNGYARFERAYDALDGWNAERYSFLDTPLLGDSREVHRSEGIARQLERDEDFPHANKSIKLHPFVVAAMQFPGMAELFVLALADGHIFEEKSSQIVLQIPERKTIILLKSFRRQIDPFVESLLGWSLKPGKWETQAKMLRELYISPQAIDCSRLNDWMDRPQPPLQQGGPDRVSLGLLTTALVRNFFKNQQRRW